MKVTKNFSIDMIYVDKLSKEPNASKLVNELLRAHYNYEYIDSLTDEQKEKELKKIEAWEEYQRKLNSINFGDKNNGV